jgi:flagellar biosynthesis protein FlhF
MKVKRYVALDLPEAVQAIRSELGSDAVILNTKEIRVGGFLGMFRKKRVEVIAAVDESSARLPARPAALRTRTEAPARTEAQAVPEPALATAGPAIPASEARQRYSHGMAGAERKPAPAPEAAAAAESPAAPAMAASPVQAIGAGAPGPSAGSADGGLAAAAEGTASAEPAAVLLQELRQMKEMMSRMTKQQAFRTMPEPVIRWSRRLAEQGVEPAHVELFAEEMQALLASGEGDSGTEGREAAAQVLRSWLAPAVGTGISPDTRIVRFVGPTGVGKTTTIAKLAAEQAFAHHRKIGFITADTYRIAAVDQLRTYADILNVPLEVVFSPSELARAYKKLGDKDLLMMDTAGRNYRNELFVSEVNSLLAPGEQAESILVLSMTHKYADMKLVAGHFAKYGVDRLLLTKMDETDSYGAVVNLVRDFDFKIGYITCGQTVPDDIRPFDADDLVRRLLGEPAYA